MVKAMMHVFASSCLFLFGDRTLGQARQTRGGQVLTELEAEGIT